MNLTEARKLIETRLNSNWVSTPIRWQNVEGRDSATADQNLLEFGENDFLDLSVEVNISTTITVPAFCIRYSGVMITSVYVKEGKGASLADQHTDSLITLFENKTLSGVAPNDKLRIRNIVGSVPYFLSTGWFVKETRFAFFFNRAVSL